MNLSAKLRVSAESKGKVTALVSAKAKLRCNAESIRVMSLFSAEAKLSISPGWGIQLRLNILWPRLRLKAVSK